MNWIFLILAGFAEIGGVISLKKSDGFRKLAPTLCAIAFGGASFYLLSSSLRTIPIGTAYGIWTGIGSAGSVLAGMIFFKEPKEWKRLLFISLIVISLIGLKLST
ncbi:DMT family transporter [Paenibacillus apiarius]|uniref:DMT family transporter n=1 Tax=Paenibacillus apiarius TaxID=46240 RepID=UPI00198270C0|nr:multidrug efflux SMR transporter [Paenibacillus apiarius]MBN3525047.1 multidrug efflux SMR transporter [Paenibacillus apiarius]